MIYDKIERLNKYKGVIPHIQEVVEFFNNTDLLELPYNEKINISKNVYAIRSKYYGKSLSEALVESHLKYIDIQFIISGKEMIYYGLAPENKGDHVGYDENKDIIYYEEYLINRVVLEPNEFAVFFKEDLHQPGVKYNDNKIDKLVVKVRVKEEKKEVEGE